MTVSELIRQLNKIKKHTPDIEVCFINVNDEIESVSKVGTGFYENILPLTSDKLLTPREVPEVGEVTKILVLG